MVTIETALIAFPMQIHAQVLPAVTAAPVSSAVLVPPFAYATTATVPQLASHALPLKIHVQVLPAVTTAPV
jgi:hypothetical protein